MQGIQGFGNSLAFDENGNTPTCIVYYAMKNEEIIALAGASKESDAMWEIGVDVKEPFRNEGLATTLVNHLVLSILNAYKQSPTSKSKRRRWGYGGMLMSEGVKAPSDKLRSSMRS